MPENAGVARRRDKRKEKDRERSMGTIDGNRTTPVESAGSVEGRIKLEHSHSRTREESLLETPQHASAAQYCHGQFQDILE